MGEKERKKDTREFLKLCGTWEDDRSAEEIIEDIYKSRKSSERFSSDIGIDLVNSI